MRFKILFTPSDNNLAGAFQSMVRLCVLLRDKYGCEILVLLRKRGKGEILLKENNIRYRKVTSFNWIIPDHPTSLFRIIELCVRFVTKPFAQAYNQVSIMRIKKILRDEKIDIVHQNTTYIYAPAKAAFDYGIPVVWHIREFLEEDQHKRIWNRKYGYKLISKASAVIAVSERLYRKYKQLLPNATIYKIYNGIDANYYSSPKRKLFTNGTVQLLMVGTINESKGQYQAIEACRRLVNEGVTNIKMTVVGELTRYAVRLKDYVEREGLAPYIEFTGLQKDTAFYYHVSDIVLMCSRFEAFGRVTVEAMMSGCIVIGANTGGTVELINDKVTGYLYNSGDINSLLWKIKYVMDHKEEANTVAQKGQTYMLSNMTAEKNADAVYSVYLDVLRSN